MQLEIEFMEKQLKAVADANRLKILACLKKAIESEVCALEHLLKKQNKVEQAYKNMAKGKKPAITPVTLGEQQYSEKWLAVNYKKKPFDENYTISKMNPQKSKQLAHHRNNGCQKNGRYAKTR